MPRIPTKPDLLKRQQRKARAKATDNAPAGTWSADKAALAVIAYEKKGGEWKQADKATNTRRALDARRRRRKET